MKCIFCLKEIGNYSKCDCTGYYVYYNDEHISYWVNYNGKTWRYYQFKGKTVIHAFGRSPIVYDKYLNLHPQNFVKHMELMEFYS